MKTYTPINLEKPESNTELLKVIDTLYHVVLSAGGDGGAIWYSKYYDIKQIKPLIEYYQWGRTFKWRFVNESELTFNWGDNQEWVTVTNDISLYNSQPDWHDIKIIH